MEIENIFFNISDYEFQPQEIGNGSFSKVYLVRNNKDNQQYAAKVINVGKNFDGNEQKMFLRESLILSKLNHHSIVKFFGINFNSFENQNILQPTIITEYLANGSLRDILNKAISSTSKCSFNHGTCHR